jgi:hypothetical protein
MRIGRGLVELGLQRFDLSPQSCDFCLEPHNLLAQSSTENRLRCAPWTPAEGLTFAHILSSGILTPP